MLVLDLPLPSVCGGKAGGADLNPKSLSYERAMGRYHQWGMLPAPGVQPQCPEELQGQQHPCLVAATLTPDTLRSSPQILFF